MAHELAVWLFADEVGTLSLSDGRLNFRYRRTAKGGRVIKLLNKKSINSDLFGSL